MVINSYSVHECYIVQIVEETLVSTEWTRKKTHTQYRYIYNTYSKTMVLFKLYTKLTPEKTIINNWCLSILIFGYHSPWFTSVKGEHWGMKWAITHITILNLFTNIWSHWHNLNHKNLTLREHNQTGWCD